MWRTTAVYLYKTELQCSLEAAKPGVSKFSSPGEEGKGGNKALLGLIHGGKRKNSNSQTGRYANGADPAQSPSSLTELVPTLCYWGIKLGNAQEFYWENQACI